MLSSINPLGERGRQNRWGVTAAWYIAGSVFGAGLLGASLGAAGWAVQAMVRPSQALLLLTAALIGLAGAAVDAGVGGLRLPTTGRQVNENWLGRYRSWLYGVGFGFQLGLGVATIVTTAAIYVAWLLAALSGSVWAGAIIGIAFGFVRSVVLLLARGAASPRALRQVLARFQRWKPAARRLALSAQVAVAAMASLAAW